MSADTFVRDKLAWLEQIALDPNLPPISVRLGIILAGGLNRHTGDCWWSIVRFAATLSCSRKGVMGGLQRLADAGHLTVKKGRGRSASNRYRPLLQPINRSPDGDHLSANRPPCGDHLSDDIRSPFEPEMVTKRDLKRSPHGDPNPLIEPFEESIDRGDSPLTPHFVEKSDDADGYQIASWFNTFWALFPEWADPSFRASAKIEFEKVLREGRARPDEIIDGVRAYAVERSAEIDLAKRRKYTARPANWLRDGRWADTRLPSGLVIDERGNSVPSVVVHQPTAHRHRRQGQSYPEIAAAMIARKREGHDAY